MKDSSIFKSSGISLLASPTYSKQSNEPLQNNNHFFSNKSSSRGDSNSRQVQQQQQIQEQQIQQVQQTLYENLQNISQTKLQQNGYSSNNGSRKQSLIAKNMSSEQLKDWLVGKQTNSPMFPQIDQNKTQINSLAINNTICLNTRKNDSKGLLKISKTFNSSYQNEEEDGGQTEEIQLKQTNPKVQRRSKSSTTLQLIPELEQTSKYIMNQKIGQQQKSLLGGYLFDSKYEKNDNEDDTDMSTSQMSRVNARKRQKNPSFNPTTVSLFEMQKQESIKQQLYKQNSVIDQLTSNQNQGQPQVEINEQKLQNSKSAIFVSPNKFNRTVFGFTDSSPIRTPSEKTNISQISLNSTQQNSLANIVNGPQLQTNLSQRQIYLKNLQINADANKFLELPSKQTPKNIIFGSQQSNNIFNDPNKQLTKKIISPLQAPSQPLFDDILTTTTSSSQNSSILPIRSKRQSKTFSNIDNIQKYQINPTNAMSNTKYRAFGSYSSLDDQYQIQNQPKGILKQRKENSKLKKSVVFDKKLQVHELNEQQQA